MSRTKKLRVQGYPRSEDPDDEVPCLVEEMSDGEGRAVQLDAEDVVLLSRANNRTEVRGRLERDIKPKKEPKQQMLIDEWINDDGCDPTPSIKDARDRVKEHSVEKVNGDWSEEEEAKIRSALRYFGFDARSKVERSKATLTATTGEEEKIRMMKRTLQHAQEHADSEVRGPDMIVGVDYEGEYW